LLLRKDWGCEWEVVEGKEGEALEEEELIEALEAELLAESKGSI